ncbi:putative RNA helicase armi isoform 2-T3 [Glossina fuscipes fuscipes]
MFFHGIRSADGQENDAPSWCKFYEAKELYRRNIKAESIGIISPYMKRVKHLRKLFVQADVAMPKIGFVEEFQGQERDILLISGVRSSKEHIRDDMHHGLGFIRNERSTKLAISRPRYLLMIYGNPELLCLDPRWRAIINYCIINYCMPTSLICRQRCLTHQS